FKARYRVAGLPGLPRFNGGLVGYFSYDTVRYVTPEVADCPNPDPLATPDILLLVSEAAVVLDNLAGTLHLIVLADPQQPDAYANGMAQLDRLGESLRQPLTPRPGVDLSQSQLPEPAFESSFSREAFERAVEHIRQDIAAGDSLQVVISQRMSVDFKA